MSDLTLLVADWLIVDSLLALLNSTQFLGITAIFVCSLHPALSVHDGIRKSSLTLKE